MNPTAPDVRVSSDLDALSRAAAGAVIEHAERAVRERGRFSWALAGGGTPKHLYRLLATDFRDLMPWRETHVFWGDERFVPPAHPASNYRMAHEAMLQHVPLPADHVHPVDTQAPSPARAADAYETQLRSFFGEGDDAPAFDLVLLGLGEDGHTASLFPEDEPWNAPEGSRWVRAVMGPPRVPSRRRITLTLAALDAARRAFFLVAGAAKRDVLRAILDGAPEREGYPAAHVNSAEGVTWFLDVGAYG